MNVYKRFAAGLAAMIMCLSQPLAAHAADVEIAEAPATETTAEISFEGKGWDDVMDELLEAYGTTRYSVSAMYLNLVTGEEYSINPDNYMPAGALYQLPLNMHFADTKYSAEHNWALNHPELDLAALRQSTLSAADEAQAQMMCTVLGGYEQFRLDTAEYMGLNTDSVKPENIADNLYSAREFAQCLKLLYSDSQRFPGILEAMQAGEASGFGTQETTAHKPGSISVKDDVYVHDCGIVFGTEPVALVLMSCNVPDAEGLMDSYAKLMADFAEYRRTAPDTAPEVSEIAAPSLVEQTITLGAEGEKLSFPFIALAAVVIFVIAALGLVIGLCVKYRLRFFWLMLAIAISAGTMLLSIVGMHMGTVYAKPSGDPRESAVSFLESICSGDYPAAYELLRDYDNLGLEKVPETEAGKLVHEALHKSFSYELQGECNVVKLDAVQPYSFTYLDLSRLESAIVEETPKQLRRLVASRPMNQIYDSNRNFLPEVTEEAYLNAIRAVLDNAESYYSTAQLQLQLGYSGGRWQILASPALLKALNGGAGY